ncbi:MAG: hypothetical protein LH485_03420 [Sphingomonas bacterium]|nr:hypothetical protein [Sphingomonas bacterium]
MTRFASLILAAAALAGTPAIAATYSAKPVTQPEASRIIARDISWACGPDACQGSTEESRPSVLCQGLAKRAGRLTSFIANGRAFGDPELARCNASAKGGAPSSQALANTN